MFICISDTASLWKRVQADPLFECADFDLLSLQSENCPDSLLQVLAGEFPQCTATVSIYMYLHCITTFLFNVKKIIFCLIWSLWKSHFYVEFNYFFIYVKIPTLVNLIATFVPCTRTCMSFNVYVCIPMLTITVWKLDF